LDEGRDGEPDARSCPGHTSSAPLDHGELWNRASIAGFGTLANRRGIQYDFILPAKPVEHACMESLKRRLLDDCVDVHQFILQAEAQAIIEAGRSGYISDGLPARLGT